MRAVIFDLWDTLVVFRGDALEELYTQMATDAGVDPAELTQAFHDTHLERSTGPLRDNVAAVLAALGADDGHVDAFVDLRREQTRRALVPREGAIETLEELRRRGYKRGLLSVCSGDVADVWEQTQLAAHLDDAVLSCNVGLRKPDPRIYELAARNLGVTPEECLFVGDGANDELAGAERVGMRAVCILPPDRDEPLWPEAHGWKPMITDPRQVLELL